MRLQNLGDQSGGKSKPAMPLQCFRTGNKRAGGGRMAVIRAVCALYSCIAVAQL
jgi:hypothetical protein